MLGLKFRRQFPISNYVVDFYCEELRLVVELEGSVHDDVVKARADEMRRVQLQELGYRVLRVPNGMVLGAPDQFEAEIQKILADL
jgi:uroporphyrinogen-III synthase